MARLSAKTIMENTFKIELTSKLPHEQRVIVEANELGTKTFALKTFIDSNPIFEKLEIDEKERLHLQYNLMKSYWEILEKRIQNFKDLFSQESIEQTFGEKAVGLQFNPSQLSDVDKVKRAFADIIDKCNDIQCTSYLGNTLKGMAIRACIEAQMAVVKLITFKE